MRPAYFAQGVVVLSLLFAIVKSQFCGPTPGDRKPSIWDTICGLFVSVFSDISQMKIVVWTTAGLASLARGAPGRFYCDGTVAGPLRIQFAQFLDVGAFGDENVRTAYREDAVTAVQLLTSTFGPSLQYKLYYYNTKGPDAKLGCGYQPIQDAFLSSSEAKQKVSDELSSLGMDTLGPRTSKYSSLSDAVYYAMRADAANWNKNERDEEGVPILRIFSIGTDVATWVNETESDDDQWPWDLGTSRLEECKNHPYPGTKSHLVAAYDAFPDLGTYFMVLSQTNSITSDIPDVTDWYQTTFLPKYLGGVKGYSEALGTDGRHAKHTLELTRKIACEYWAKVAPPETPSCPDVNPPLHLQLTVFVDVAAFSDETQRSKYRNELLGAVEELESVYGSQTEVQVYTYSNRPEPGTQPSDSYCGKRLAALSSPSDASAQLAAEFANVGLAGRPVTDSNRGKTFSSLQDCVFHALASPLWIKQDVDSNGLPVVRMVHFASDVTPWTEGSSMYGTMRLTSVEDAQGSIGPADYCEGVDYPHRNQTKALSMEGPRIAYHGIVYDQSLPEVNSTVAWYKKQYKRALGSPWWKIDTFQQISDYKSNILGRIEEAVCAELSLSSVPTTSTPTSVPQGSCKEQLQAYVDLLSL